MWTKVIGLLSLLNIFYVRVLFPDHYCGMLATLGWCCLKVGEGALLMCRISLPLGRKQTNMDKILTYV